jgi:hypothetical protein
LQPDRLPSQLIQPAPENLQWFVDEAAASALTKINRKDNATQ